MKQTSVLLAALLIAAISAAKTRSTVPDSPCPPIEGARSEKPTGDNQCPPNMDYVKIDIGTSTRQQWKTSAGINITGKFATAGWTGTSPYNLDWWTSDLIVDLMIIKCSTWATEKWYNPSVLSDVTTGLPCIGNQGPDHPQAYSHISLCRYPRANIDKLTVTSADLKYYVDRTYSWDITKSVVPPTVTIMNGVPDASPLVTIHAWPTETSCSVSVTGIINVYNPSTTATAHVTSVYVAVYSSTAVEIGTAELVLIPITLGPLSSVDVPVSVTGLSCVSMPASMNYAVSTDFPWCSETPASGTGCPGTIPDIDQAICGNSASGSITLGGSSGIPCVDIYDTKGCGAVIGGPTTALVASGCPPTEITRTYTITPEDILAGQGADICDTASICETGVTPTSLCKSATVTLDVVIANTGPTYPGCTYTIGYWRNHAGSNPGRQANVVHDLLQIDPDYYMLLMASDGKISSCIHGVVASVPAPLPSDECYNHNTISTSDSAVVASWVTPNSDFFSSCVSGKKNIRRQLFMQLAAVELNLASIWRYVNPTLPYPGSGIVDLTNMVPTNVATAIHDGHHILHRFSCAMWEGKSTSSVFYATTTTFAGSLTYHARASEIHALLDQWNNGLIVGAQPHCD